MNKKKLIELINKIQPKQILVVGDLILDEFISGEVIRMSREAPIPVVKKQKVEYIPGGAANAINNIASLRGNVYPIGTIGNDISGKNLIQKLNEENVNTKNIIFDKNNPTTTKTRISANSRQSVKQQIARIDTLPDKEITNEIEISLIKKIKALIKDMDCILISDYGYGVITNKVIEAIIDESKINNKPLIVDTQKDLSYFKGITIATPNQPEAENIVGHKIYDDKSLMEAGEKLLKITEADSMLITRGSEGMSLFEKNGKVTNIPAFNKREVFDVTGAGDTVAAMLSLALANNLDKVSAMYLANFAASIVVKRFGTSKTTLDEMKNELLKEN